jgi:SMC interacting uncharacterized protein involved in chromosome segregation
MRSTIGQLKEFKNSFIYQDIVEELGVWLGDVQEQLEVQIHPESQLRILQGNAETLRNVLHLIDQFIENSEADVDESDKDQLEKELDEIEVDDDTLD